MQKHKLWAHSKFKQLLPAMVSCILLAAAALPVHAAPASGSISGQITNTSGNPVSGALVYSDTNGVIQSQYTTGGDGRYTLNGLQAGARHVVVEHNSYANAHRYNVNVADGSTTQNINFSITTQMGQLAGRVTNAGQPVANVVVLAGGVQGSGYGYDHTDANGNYLITRLAPMDYLVNAWLPDGRSMSLNATVNNGQTSNLNFGFSNPSSGGITGRILIDSAQPAPNASVYILPRDGSGTNYAGYSDTNGFYSAAALTPTYYDVHVSGVAGYPNLMWGMLSVGSNVITANFNLTKGNGTVIGRATDSLGQPLIGAKIQVFCWEPNPCTYAETYTNSLGEYTVTDMWGGTYVAYADYGSYERVTKNNLSVTGNGTTRIDFVLGGPPTLVSDTSNLSVMTIGPYGTYRTVLIDVSSGPAVSWTASTPQNVSWLYLGSSGTQHQTSGQTGLDVLWLQFHPENVGNGTYNTTVTVTSSTASTIQIGVTLIRTASGINIFLPYIKR